MGGIFSALMVGCLLWLQLFPAEAASDLANRLRSMNGLSVFTPQESFLQGNFVADEIEPAFLFGSVGEFAKSRTCTTTWLIDAAEQKRVEGAGQQTAPAEYTLYLEEDCPGKVTCYVFVDRSRANSAQWLEWRKQFHKSKAEPQYGAVKNSLEQASEKGFPVAGELRFVEIDGNLQVKKPEAILLEELKLQPIYDLRQGRATAP
jgi:hypothetical protein